MRCIYCDEEAGEYDEHEECWQRSCEEEFADDEPDRYPSVTHTPEWHEDPTHIYDPDTNPSGCDKFYCLSRFNPERYPSVTDEP